MATKRTLLVLHCTATPEGMEIDSNWIQRVHLGPKDLDGGKVYFKGKTYPSRSKLPKVLIGGQPIQNMKGRGWSQMGYKELVKIDGTRVPLVADNQDMFVDQWEITNGVSGQNRWAAHVVYAGGMDKDNKKAKDTRTPKQIESLKQSIFEHIATNPDIKIAGHYHFAAKACPSFDVEKFCEEIGVPEKNIYRKP